MLKYMKCCLKTKNDCLKILTKHPLSVFKCLFGKELWGCECEISYIGEFY